MTDGEYQGFNYLQIRTNPTSFKIKSENISESPKSEVEDSSKAKIKKEKIIKSYLNDPLCIQNRNFLLENPKFDIFKSAELNKLLCHLREYSSYCSMNRRYDEAKASDELFDQVQEELVKRSVPKSNSEEINDAFRVQKQQEIDKLDLEIIDFDEETQDKKIVLLKRQMDESDSFEKLWREEKPPKYRKPSKKLLYLLASEKRCARNRRYDEAKLYQQEAEELAAKETHLSQKKLNYDYKVAKEKFIQKQDEELRKFEETREEHRSLLLKKRRKILETLAKRENIIRERASQPPKALAINDNHWLRIDSSNVAKMMYDDQITTYENPLAPLKPPNDESAYESDSQPGNMNKKEKLDKKAQMLQQVDDDKNGKIKSSKSTSSSISSSKLSERSNTSDKKGLDPKSVRISSNLKRKKDHFLLTQVNRNILSSEENHLPPKIISSKEQVIKKHSSGILNDSDFSVSNSSKNSKKHFNSNKVDQSSSRKGFSSREHNPKEVDTKEFESQDMSESSSSLDISDLDL